MMAEFLYLLLHCMGGIMSFCLKPINRKTALHRYVTRKGRSLWVPGSVLATWAPQTILWELLARHIIKCIFKCTVFISVVTNCNLKLYNLTSWHNLSQKCSATNLKHPEQQYLLLLQMFIHDVKFCCTQHSFLKSLPTKGFQAMAIFSCNI